MIWLAILTVLVVADYLRLGRRLYRWLDPSERELAQQVRVLRAERKRELEVWAQIMTAFDSSERCCREWECSCSWARKIEACERDVVAAQGAVALARRLGVPRERLTFLADLLQYRRGTVAYLRALVPPRGVQRNRVTHRTHRGRSRNARHAAPRVRGSRRSAARTTLNTGPPGADDGAEPEPPSRWTTTGADRQSERTKTARRETCIVWIGGGANRRVAETKTRNDESPRSGQHFEGILSRAVRRELAGPTARILADSRPAKQPPHRATEAAGGG